MNVNLHQVRRLISDHRNNQELLVKILRRVFSFKENINEFAHFFFKEYASAPSAAFHSEVYEFLFEPEDDALAAPRGHAKSTVVGLFYLSFCIVNKLEPYIIYMSSNHSKTVQFLDPIRSEFTHNKLLKWVYGDVKFGNVKDNDGKDREDCFDVNNCRVEAVSFEKNLRGFKYKANRPTLIILDDIEDDQRVLNPALRVKDADKLNKIVIPSLDPVNGKIKFIGTILHWDSLLIKKIRLYGGKIYKACTNDLKDILWPEYWNEERLRKKKRSIGSVSFASEFLNDPIEHKSSLIQRDWMVKACDEKLSYQDAAMSKYDFKVQGVDFAFADRVTADKSAFVGVGRDADKYTILSCVEKQGMTTTEQFDYIQYLHGIYGFNDNALEENSIRSMSNALKLETWTFPFTLFWTGAADPTHPRKIETEFDKKRHTVGKAAMINRLATQFENGMITMPYMSDKDKMVTNQIMAECSTYALAEGKLVEVGIHGDIPIALAYAIERCEMETFEFVGGML